MPKSASGTKDLKSNAATRTSISSNTKANTTQRGGLLGGGQGGGLLGSPMPVSRPGSYAGPKGTTSLNEAARYASVGGPTAMPRVQATPRELDTMSRLMLAETGGVKNPMGGISTPGMLGVADVLRNRVVSDQYPDSLGKVMNQGAFGRSPQFSPMGLAYGRKVNDYGPDSPGYQQAHDVAKAVLSGEQAPTVGNSLNYANLNTINGPQSQASPRTRQAFNSMPQVATLQSAQNPAMQHTFGTMGKPSDVSFPGQALQHRQLQTASAPAISPAIASSPESEPSMWQKYAPQGLQAAATSIDQNIIQPTKEQIAKYGGFERAGKLAQLAVGVMNFLPGGEGMANNQLPPGAGQAPENMGGRQTPPPQQQATAPPTAPVNQTSAAPTPQTHPWLYPEYSQKWAGLPTGIGGYARG